MVGLNNRNLLLGVLEAEKSRIKALTVPVSGESTFPGLQIDVCHVLKSLPSREEGERERGSQLSPVSAYNGTDPFMSAPLLHLNHLVKGGILT